MDKVFIVVDDAFLLVMERWGDQEASATKTGTIF